MFFKKKADVTPFRRSGLSLAPVGENRRGLFCSEMIKAGETIETIPMMLFNDTDAAGLHKAGLGGFLLTAPSLSRGVRVVEQFRQRRNRASFTVMGAGAFCGRRRDPNAASRIVESAHTAFYSLTAARDIAPGTEICLGYADGAAQADFNQKECGTAPLFGENPVELFLRGGLYLKLLAGKGRGVFCREDIKAGETIEICPVLVLDDAQGTAARESRLYSYIFTASSLPSATALRAGIKDFSDGALFALGLVSYYNHLHVPNATEDLVLGARSCHFRLSAVKDIAAGTEICIDYGLGWLSHQRLWEKRQAQKKIAERKD